MDKIVLVEVKSEIGAGTRGASLGPEALKVAANRIENRYFKSYKSIAVINSNDLLLADTEFRYARNIDGLLSVCEGVSNSVKGVLEEGREFPLILAGDHSTAAGTISGIKMANPDKRVGVIWVDAHADIHTPYTTPSGNLHGMPLTICFGEDHMKCRMNEPKEEALDYWNKLKNLGGISPKINPQDVIYIGVRDTEWPEDDLMDSNRMINYTIEETRKTGPKEIGKKALEDLRDCDLIYVSYDVDVLDSNLSKGTGTPVPNGLWLNEVEELLVEILKSKKVCCFEMVEINPCLDNKGNLMAEMAFQVLKKCTHRIEMTHELNRIKP